MPRPVTLSLDLLRTFTKLVEREGDALAAADELDINQPSMSKRLRYLQHAGRVLNEPWLRREGKSWRLTDQGREVLAAVQEIVRRYDQLSGFVNKPSVTTQRPVVKFACGPLAATGLAREAAHLFARWTARQTDDNKQARLQIATPRGKLRVRGVAMGSFDLALVTYDEMAITRIAHRRLHAETLETEHLALVCSERFKLWNERVSALKDGKVKPSDLVDMPLILPEPASGPRRTLDRVFKRAGVAAKLDVVLEIGGWQIILESVRSRLGVAIVNEGALFDGQEVITRRLDPASFPPSAARLICRSRLDRPEELDLTPAAQAFREALTEAAGKRKAQRRR